jgi:flagellar biosynthesis/type III secretory pathway chaperone
MIAFDDVLARLDELGALLVEERELLEKSDIGGLESMMVRKESLLRTLFLSDSETPDENAVHPLRDVGFTDDQRMKLEKRFEALVSDNTINGALIDAARVRANALGALVASRGPNAVYGERGRLRGSVPGARLTRTA